MLSFLKQESGFYKQVFFLTIPIVLQNIITSTLTMADTFMVGMLGEAQMAALTLANIPIFVLQLFLFGVQSGSSILMSQYWGKQDLVNIQRVLGLAMWLSFFISGSFALVMFLHPVEFLSFFGNDPVVVELAASYGQLIGIAFFFNSFTLMYVAAYRSMGKPQLGMYLLGISMVLNLVLNWIFIFGNLGAPALGVRGAAVGTCLARMVEFTIMVIHSQTTSHLRLEPKEMLLPHKETIVKFITYSSPVVLAETAWGLGTSVFTTVMGHMDNSMEILAAQAVAANVERLVMVAGYGTAASTAILIGNAIGAGLPKERVIAKANALAFLGTSIGFFSGLVLVALSFTLLPQFLAPTFGLSEESTSIAQILMLMLALFMAQRTFNTIVVVGIFRGGGDTKKSMIVDLAPLWFVAIPLSIFFGVTLKLSVFWVALAMASESFVKFFIGIYYLRRNDWIRNVTESIPDV